MALGPAGNSLFIPTGPAPDFNALILEDPFYKQQLQWLTEQQQTAAARLGQDKSFAEQMFALNQQQLNQSALAANQASDLALGQTQAEADIAKQRAAVENANRAEYLREWLSSRGMADSGQRNLEQNQQAYAFGNTLQDIDRGVNARVAETALEKTNRQASLALQLQQLALGNQQDLLGIARESEDIPTRYARERGAVAFETYKRLLDSGRLNTPGINAMWDPESQLYVTAGGEYYAVDANGNPYKTSWSRTPAAAATTAAPAATQEPWPDWLQLTPTGQDPLGYPYYYGGQYGTVYAE